MYNLKLEEGGSIGQFLKDVKDVSNQLIAIGKPISNDKIVEYVLNALPKSYENFMSFIGLWNQLPSITTFKGLLLHDKARKELQQSKRICKG